MRAHLDQRGIYACRARRARDIFVIHTRPELVSAVQFFGTVKLAGTPSIPARFISHPHCKFPFPCLQRFPYPVELAAPPSHRGNARVRSLLSQKVSRGSIPRAQAELLSANPPPPFILFRLQFLSFFFLAALC